MQPIDANVGLNIQSDIDQLLCIVYSCEFAYVSANVVRINVRTEEPGHLNRVFFLKYGKIIYFAEH